MDTSPATGPVGSDPIPTPVTDAARRLSQLSFGVAGLAISAGRHLAERTRQAAAPHASSDAAMGTAPFDTAPFDTAPLDTATVGTPVPPVPAPPVPSSLVTVPPKVGPVGLVGGALLGAGYVAQARILDVSAAVEVRTTKLSRRLLAAQGARGAAARPPSIVVRRLEPWFEIGAAHQAHSEAAVAATVSRLVPDMLDAAIAGIDLPRLLRRLPIDEMLDDLLDEIDLNALLARIDLDALLDRVDLDSLLRKVDIGAIVLGSTGTVTTEAVDASRGLAVRADTLVSRVTDKVLFRRGGRRLGVEGFDRIAPALGPKPKPAAIDVIGGPAPVDRRED